MIKLKIIAGTRDKKKKKKISIQTFEQRRSSLIFITNIHLSKHIFQHDFLNTSLSQLLWVTV